MAIARMTRVFIAGPVDKQEETVRFLQKLGVMHVEPASEMAGEFEKKNNEVLASIKKLDQLLAGIRSFRTKKPGQASSIPDDELVNYAEEKISTFQDLESRADSYERLIADLSMWGDFDPSEIKSLEKSGVYIRRYSMDAKKWDAFNPPDDILLEVVYKKREVLFYTVSMGAPPEIPQASLLTLPEMSLDEAESKLQLIKEQMDELAIELAGIFERSDDIKKKYLSAMNEAAYTGNMATLHREDYLFGLQGWIPKDQERKLLEKIKEAGLPLKVVTRDPLEDEDPPVLLRNNWFIRMIEPLQKLYGNPGYRHLDPSGFFAPFMVLFFGICLSDAGYGILVFIIAHIIGKKLGGRIEGLPLVIRLCKTFGVAAIVVGSITGSFFGYGFENRDWILLDIDVDAGNPMLLFYLSLGLGVIHLSISYLMGIAQTRYFHVKMQKLGLTFVLWGAVLLISRNIWFGTPEAALHIPFFYGGVVLLVLGLLLTLFFPNNSKKWALRMGLGLWNIYGLTSLVGDLLSYARLFGLGIATSAVAAVMNQLAAMAVAATGPVIGVPVALIIIIFGHTFNLALALLGSTVHSARLHFVEAFKSFFEGGGVEYKPFKIERGSFHEQ